MAEAGWLEAEGLPAGLRGGTALRSFPGVSVGDQGPGNFGAHCGDRPEHVAHNRAALAVALALPAAPRWLRQVHGVDVADGDAAGAGEIVADACVMRLGPAPAVVLTADCLPLLIASRDGAAYAAVHAGWRGLAAGVIEASVRALAGSADLQVWLGPAIGPEAYEIGPDVRAALLAADAGAADCFARGRADRWHADLYALARRRLRALGIDHIAGGQYCTLRDPVRFHSHRRDGAASGRMATLIWRC